MSKEYDILSALGSHLQSYLSLEATQVVVNDWPDADRMRHNVMLYVVPDRIEIDEGTLRTDQCRLYGKLYILIKGKPIAEALYDALDYWAGAHQAFITDPTLGGSVAEIAIVAADIYPTVLTNVCGIEVDWSALYERVEALLPGEWTPGDYIVPTGG